MRIRYRVAILIFLALAAVQPAAGQKAADKESPISVTAVQLTKEYAKDAKAADKKYEDKVLIVEGVFLEGKTIDESGVKFNVIVLQGFNEKEPKPLRVIAGYRDAQKDSFSKLKKGQKIKIKGKCTGFGVGESVKGQVVFSFVELVK